MADQTERIIIEIDGSSVKGDAQQVERAINTIGDAADKAGKKVTTAEKSINELGGALKTTGSSAKSTERDFQSLQSTIGNAKPAQAQADALKQVANSAKQSASATDALDKRMGAASSEIDKISGASKKASTAVREIGVNSQRSAASMAMMTNAAGAFGVALSVAGLVQFGASVIKAGIAMDALQRSFIAITGSQTAAAQELKFLREEADRLGQSFFDLAPVYKSVSAAARGTALEGDAVRKVFSSITEASSALGMSTSDTEGALLALGQMISKGTVQAEELRGQLGERLPGAFNIMARALGVTTSELGKMLEQGQVLADDALPKLAAEISKMYGKAAETAALESAQAAVNKLSEAWTSLKTNLFDSQAFVYATNFLRETVEEWDRILFSVSKTELAAQERSTAMLLKAKKDQLANLKGYEGDFITDIFRAGDISDLESEIAELTKSLGKVRGEIASLAPASKESFAALQDGMNKAGGRAGEYIKDLQAADTELKKLTATALDKLEAQYNALKGRVSDSAALDRWYLAERAKIEEAATKKQAAELKKQIAADKKARAEMLKGSKEAEKAIAEYWENYEDARIKVISDSAAETVKIRTEAEKEAADKAKEILEKQQADAEKVMDRIQEGTADVFYDMFQDIGNGWETLWDSMKNWALRTLAELAARAATVNIVVPIMTSMTGTSSAAQAVQSLTGGQGGMGNMPFGSLMGGENGMFSGVASSINTWGANTFPGVFGGATLAPAGTPLASMVASPSASLAAAQAGTTLGTPLVSSGTSMLGAIGGAAGIAGGIYQMTQGGTGNMIAGAGTAIGGAMMFTPAAPFAPLVMVGSQILGGMFGEDERSPSVIFNAQSTEWGSTDSSRRANDGGNKRLGFEFHTKDGASSSTGVELATALEGVASTAFDSIEATLSGFGDQYVDMLDGTVIEFGRKVEGAAGGSWDFGSDMDFEKLFAEYSGKLQGAILAAAEGAFNAAGRDIASGESATTALGMLSEKAGEQFASLQSAIQAGVQSGDVNAYAAQIQSLQAIVQSITSAWESVSQASAELVNPLTQYEQAQRSVNQQYDVWIAQLEAIGFASEKVAQIDADRVAVLGQLADENRKAIDDVLQTSAQIATPLSESAAAVQQVNEKFDSLVEQADALGAAETALAQIERDRETALKRLGITTEGSTAAIEKTITELSKAVADLTSEITSGLKAMVASARSALSTAYNAERESIESALSATIDGLQGQIGGIDDQIGGRESAKSAWESVANSLKSAVSDIMPMSLAQAMSALDGYIRGAFAGQAPDEYGLGRAINTATSIGTDAYGSRVEYERAQGQAAAKLATLASISDTRVSVEQQQLDALTSQREALDAQIALAESAGAAQLEALELTYQNAVAQLDALEGIEKYSGTMDNALAMIQSLTRQYGDIQAGLARAQATAALGTYDAMTKAVTILETIRAGMGGADVPGFASGGYHSGGLRIVGENGPELEYTGPSRIWSADDTRAMLSGGSDGTAAEIRALRDDLRTQSAAMVAMQQKMNKLLGRWDYNGMPETRVVA